MVDESPRKSLKLRKIYVKKGFGSLQICVVNSDRFQMAEEMRNDNIFIFGMTVDDVDKLQCAGYNAMDFYNSNEELRQVNIRAPVCRIQHHGLLQQQPGAQTGTANQCHNLFFTFLLEKISKLFLLTFFCN